MTRDYVNYKRKRERQGKRSLFVLVVLLFFALLPGVAFYTHKQQLTFATLKEAAAQKVSAYFPQVLSKQKKLPLHKKVVANTQESTKPIHFDFYDELPKAQLDLPQAQTAEEDETVEEPKTTVAAVKKTMAASAPVAAVTASEPAPASLVSPHVSQHEEEVVQELASDLTSMKAAETASPYIIQLSVFHSLDAAKRYRAALASAGLKVDLVKLRLGKEVVYRLQQGPYHNLDQLKLAKKRLTERGIACDIRKLSPYIM